MAAFFSFLGSSNQSINQSATANNLAQRLDLLLVLDEPSARAHDAVDDLEHAPETAGRAFDLYEPRDRQAYFAAVLEDDEDLDAEGDGPDVERVGLVDARRDAVVLARVLQVADAVALPLLEEQDELLAGAAARDGEADEAGGGLDVEESSEPGAFGPGGCWVGAAD